MRTIFGVLLAASLPAGAQGPRLEEYELNAAYLYNFAKFVEWPASAFASSSEPIAICVAGDRSFSAVLDRTVRGKSAAGRAIEVRVFTGQQPLNKCQILFVAGSERKRAWAILDQVVATSILTVGEDDEFTAVGGMVNLKREGQRVRIQIALDTVEHARLVISSKLLTLAEIVRK